MEIKYCKNCSNFTPIYQRTKPTEPHNGFSMGFCRVINKINVKDDVVSLVPKQSIEVGIEGEVIANQVISVDSKRICPAFYNLSDVFYTENINLNVSNLDLLQDLYYVICKKCLLIFASPLKELEETNEYTCPMCFNNNTYEKYEHFKRKAMFYRGKVFE